MKEIINYLWLLPHRASDFQLREPGFKSCAAVLKPWTSFFTLHCSSSLSCINEYLAIDSGGYVYEQSSCINCSIWLDVPREVEMVFDWTGLPGKCFEQSWESDTVLYKNLPVFTFISCTIMSQSLKKLAYYGLERYNYLIHGKMTYQMGFLICRRAIVCIKMKYPQESSAKCHKECSVIY